jgi:hypothetical protein
MALGVMLSFLVNTCPGGGQELPPAILNDYLNLNMTDVALAESKIANLAKKVGCSAAGSAWITSTLDVFKDDEEIKATGFPDLITSNSVVRTVKLSATIGPPASVPSGSNWQANIFLDPIVSAYTMYDTTSRSAFSLDPTTQVTPVQCGGLTVRSGIEGIPLRMSNTTFALPLPAAYANPKSRVLGMGFEIHNTTAEIYKQGGLATYRKCVEVLQQDAINTFINPAITTQRGSARSLNLPGPPATLASSLLLGGTRQWNASKGVMSISTMASQVNEPSGTNYYAVNQFDAGLAVNHTWYSPLVIDAVNNNIFCTANVLNTPFNYSGAFLSGLSYQTSLLLNVIYIVETFPDEEDAQIVVLATPSPPCDFPAMELYAKTAHFLPPGVPVSMNADGDWIKNIANLLGTVGVPGMPLVSSAVDLYNSYRPAPNNPGLINFSNSTWANNPPRPLRLQNNQQQNQQLRQQRQQPPPRVAQVAQQAPQQSSQQPAGGAPQRQALSRNQRRKQNRQTNRPPQ